MLYLDWKRMTFLREVKMKSGNFGKGPSQKDRSLSNLLFVFFIVCMVSASILPVAVAQEEQQKQDVPQEEIEKYEAAKKAAKKERIDQVLEQDQTGNDPRVFSNKWMPFYRYQELENGLTQHDVTAFGTAALSPVVGMFFELPLAQYRDFSEVAGFPPDTESKALGMGDISLKFLVRPKALDFHYGKDGKMSGSVLFGTDFVLPTATDDALGGDAFLFAPIAAVVLDMPAHGFFAMLNLYYFDVFKIDYAPETSRYVGRWFYMQPLTPPGRWWGLFFLMPEFQPIYDFETKDSSLWIGLEIGKILAPGKVAYIKPGWGINNSEPTDRKSTFEFGFRWFF